MHVEPLAPPHIRRDRPQVARRGQPSAAYWRLQHAPQARTWPVFASISSQNRRASPPSRHRRATLAPHPHPPPSPAAQAFSTLFAPMRAPLAALPRSPASAGQPPHLQDPRHHQERHHPQPAAQNVVRRVTENLSTSTCINSTLRRVASTIKTGDPVRVRSQAINVTCVDVSRHIRIQLRITCDRRNFALTGPTRDDADPRYRGALSPRQKRRTERKPCAIVGILHRTVLAQNDEMGGGSNIALCEASFAKF